VTFTTGYIVWNLTTTGDAGIYATTISGGTQSSAGNIRITGGSSANTATISGVKIGGNSGSGTNAYLISSTSATKFVLIGDSTGGDKTGHCLYISGACAGISCVGHLSGGGATSRGLYWDNAGTLALNMGGNTIYGSSSGTANFSSNGLIVAIGSCTITNTNIINGTKAVAFLGVPPTTLTNTGNAYYCTIATSGTPTKYVGEIAANLISTGTVQGPVTGTLDGEAHTASEVLTTASSPGNVVLPGVDIVKDGEFFGPESALEGTLVEEAHTASEVLTTAVVPGNVVLPAEAEVEATVTFGPSSSLTGTLVSGDNVYVDEEDTRFGVSCGLTSAPDTGLVVVPDAADVRLNVPTDVQPNLGTLIAEQEVVEVPSRYERVLTTEEKISHFNSFCDILRSAAKTVVNIDRMSEVPSEPAERKEQLDSLVKEFREALESAIFLLTVRLDFKEKIDGNILLGKYWSPATICTRAIDPLGYANYDTPCFVFNSNDVPMFDGFEEGDIVKIEGVESTYMDGEVETEHAYDQTSQLYQGPEEERSSVVWDDIGLEYPGWDIGTDWVLFGDPVRLVIFEGTGECSLVRDDMPEGPITGNKMRLGGTYVVSIRFEEYTGGRFQLYLGENLVFDSDETPVVADTVYEIVAQPIGFPGIVMVGTVLSATVDIPSVKTYKSIGRLVYEADENSSMGEVVLNPDAVITLESRAYAI
jgi:hypothetical protein